MLRISELRNKDVINMADGKRLGYIEDIDLNVEQGRIEALIIPTVQGRRFSLFAKGEEAIINWRQVKKIGADVILIDPDKRLEPITATETMQEPQFPVYKPPFNPFQKDPFAEQDELFDL